jgi:putative ABC transport system substrate-binding protein
MKKAGLVFLSLCMLISCQQKKSNVPVVAFMDAFEDNTLKKAKQGFFDALQANGFDEKNKTIEVIYRNAQGDIPALNQIIHYFNAEQPTLIAACPSLSAITAVQNSKDIPIFMMVAPTPSLMKVTDAQGNAPKNLFGVGENLDYIDSSFLLIPKIIRPKNARLKVGMIFNQSEPQSVEAKNRMTALAASEAIDLVVLPVNSSAEVQIVTASLLSKQIDVFFANPDNTVFASFETIVKACGEIKVPIITSEAGLVERGALAGYGADIYQWGYQAGVQAAGYLKNKSTKGLHWEMVKNRKHIYNQQVAATFGIDLPAYFEPMR